MEPILRFSEFKEKWEYNLFSEIVSNKSKKFNPKSNEVMQDIELDSIEQDTGRLFNTYVSKDFTSQKNIFDKGSVLYSKLRPYLNKYYYAQFSGVCSSEIWVLNSLNNQRLSNLFLYFFIQTNRFSNVANKSAGSKMPRADWSLVENIRLYKGSVEEQEKIGQFFHKIDKQIKLEEKKLELLEQQKRGYMQKIFSQELRFKDENGNDYPNWIFEELNNIFTKYQNTIYLNDNEEYKRISISNKGKITHRDITFGKTIGRKRQYLIDLKKHPNTLTFIRQGVFLGGIGFIPSSLDGYIVTENMPLLSMSEEYSKKFMTYLFSSEPYYKSVIFKNLPTGSAQKALHEKDWLKSFVNIPVYSEQEKIGNFFEKQDNLIKKQSDKVELLKERKKGFLQKMFV